MKKYSFIIASLIISLTMVGCNDFLDVQSYTTTDFTNFPETQEDVEMLVTGVYASTLYTSNEVNGSYYLVGESASDDRFGSGPNFQGFDKLMVTGDEILWDNWDRCYEGIYRANTILENIDRADGTWDSDASKDTCLGETYGLRACFYWELAQLFGSAPMPLKTAAENLPVADVDDFYATIGSDLIEAITLLPNQTYDKYERGRFTRWAAIGYLARVYLFYVGVYHNNDTNAGMPLRDGSTLSKSTVIAYLEDCINNSGHGLVDEYLDLFPYTNEYTKPDYQPLLDLEAKTGYTYNWAGESNKEVMHALTSGALAYSSASYRNWFVLWQSTPYLATLDRIFPFGYTWGHGAASPQLAEDWDAEMAATGTFDVRKFGSLIDLENEIAGDYATECVHQTKYEDSMWHTKKNCGITAYISDTEIAYSHNVLTKGVTNSHPNSYIDEFVHMRFADILLMASELSEDATYMNQVRARAHLPAVAYSLEALQKERRWELSFEGGRWNDLRRWGIAAERLETQVGQPIFCAAQLTTMKEYGGGYTARYNATNGFWMIPTSEITLSENVLVQNPGWSSTDNYKFAGY
ncbi:MAG: RagB/SusD family nutrient uptake outer membrane protein [Rikenellaceae bacterium]